MESNAPRHYWIIECHGGNPFRLHHIVNPGRGEEGWYRHISSVESFKNHEEKRSGIHGSGEKILPFEFWVFGNREYNFYNRSGCSSELNPFLGLKILEPGSIFDFYKSIAYEFKGKRYMST